MRSFIAAVVAAAVIAIIAAVSLNALQQPVEAAFTTSSVRI